MSRAVVYVVAATLLALAWTSPAAAYPFFLRHEYAGCAQCHADPSGGGLLTPYGRAQGELLLRTRYRATEDDEASARVGGFLFGAVDLPESLLLGGDARGMHLAAKANGAPATSRFVLMQADLQAQLTVGRARAFASVGYVPAGADAAALHRGGPDHAVSRLHWVGVDVDEDRQVLVRAGRLNLPFGLRSHEHALWARSATGTDTNAAQSHGVAVAYAGASFRGEVMGVVGNLQLAPDALRERGYVAFLEWAPLPRLGLGVSSLVLRADATARAAAPALRHAHGAFARWAPAAWLSFAGEIDVLHASERGRGGGGGLTGLVQADAEVVRGLHVIATGEHLAAPLDPGAAWGGWASVAWFFGPHVDVRADLAYRASPASRGGDLVLQLVQLHAYL